MLALSKSSTMSRIFFQNEITNYYTLFLSNNSKSILVFQTGIVLYVLLLLSSGVVDMLIDLMCFFLCPFCDLSKLGEKTSFNLPFQMLSWTLLQACTFEQHYLQNRTTFVEEFTRQTKMRSKVLPPLTFHSTCLSYNQQVFQTVGLLSPLPSAVLFQRKKLNTLPVLISVFC